MRRLVAAALLLVAVPARPAHAQTDVVRTSFEGCNLYFCTHADRVDFADLDDAGVPFLYHYGVDLYFTLLEPAIANDANFIIGRIGLGYTPSEDYVEGIPFSLSATGHQAGDVVVSGGSGNGRDPVPLFGALDVDLYHDPDAPGATAALFWSDHVQQVLVDVTDHGVLVNPEPATLALVGTGLAGLVAARRRRRA